jgi:HlyD family secretion protein
MTRKVIGFVLVLVALTAGVAAYYRSAGAGDEPGPVTARVTRGSVVETVSATGALEAVTTVQVGTQVSGTIKALFADYNSTVRKGQVIAQLEPSLFRTQVEGARATVARLQAEVDGARVQVADSQVKLRRARELAAAQLIAATELEAAEAAARQADAALKAAEAQVVQARASLNQSQVNLGHTTIVAPIDGVVISRSVDVGQTVAASMQAPTLFVLAQDLRRMQVNASVDEADIGRIADGQPVQFRVDAYPTERFSGVVRQVRLEPVVEQNVVSYVTVIDVPNPDLKLRPGMTATVTIEVARADDVLRVPNAALRFRPASASAATTRPQADAGTGNGRGGGNAAVWRTHQGQLERVRVTTGISDGVTTAVLGGELRVDDDVVTATAEATRAATPAASGSSPLIPQRPGRGGGSRR